MLTGYVFVQSRRSSRALDYGPEAADVSTVFDSSVLPPWTQLENREPLDLASAMRSTTTRTRTWPVSIPGLESSHRPFSPGRLDRVQSPVSNALHLSIPVLLHPPSHRLPLPPLNFHACIDAATMFDTYPIRNLNSLLQIRHNMRPLLYSQSISPSLGRKKARLFCLRWLTKRKLLSWPPRCESGRPTSRVPT